MAVAATAATVMREAASAATMEHLEAAESGEAVPHAGGGWGILLAS